MRHKPNYFFAIACVVMLAYVIVGCLATNQTANTGDHSPVELRKQLVEMRELVKVKDAEIAAMKAVLSQGDNSNAQQGLLNMLNKLDTTIKGLELSQTQTASQGDNSESKQTSIVNDPITTWIAMGSSPIVLLLYVLSDRIRFFRNIKDAMKGKGKKGVLG